MHLCVPRRVRFLVRYLPKARFTTPPTPYHPLHGGAGLGVLDG